MEGWGVFGPTLTHQVFENQVIRGYKRPRVSILYTADSLLAFMRFDYDEKRFRTPLARGEEQQVITDVPGLLAKWLPPSGVAASFDDFARVCQPLLAVLALLLSSHHRLVSRGWAHACVTGGWQAI
jgi:hypothetical protein